MRGCYDRSGYFDGWFRECQDVGWFRLLGVWGGLAVLRPDLEVELFEGLQLDEEDVSYGSELLIEDVEEPVEGLAKALDCVGPLIELLARQTTGQWLGPALLGLR